MPLHLYNTLTRRDEPFTPRDPAHVTFYSCGPTVYDDAHIGNFRSFLAADLLRRWIESPLCELANDTERTRFQSRRVTHVMNITDVGHMTDDAEGGEAGEDRMAVAGRRIAEAKKAGKLPADAKVDPSDPYQIAKFYEGRFKEDSRSLGLKLVLDADKDPSLTPRATDNIDGMKLVIETLLAKGFAYPAGNPGARVVYFDVQKFAPYGRLSGNTLDKLREGEGGRISGENQSQKRHPADFLLWKEDPSHVMKWPSPASLTGWGMGYPGWHIECTVMSVGRLLSLDAADRASGRVLSEALAKGLPNGDSLIDLHSGGEDNIFPHHECELAQSCCAFNQSPAQGTFSRLWFHPRFLFVEGAKMSKSKGNFFTARDLFAKGYEPAAVRLELIRTHYRSNADFREQGLKDCQRMLNRWSGRLGQLAAAMTKASSNNWAIAEERVELHAKDFADSMNNDLNIARAISVMNMLTDGDNGIGALVSPGIEAAWVPSRMRASLDAVAHSKDGMHRAVAEPIISMLSALGVLDAADPQAAVSTDIGLFTGIAPDPAVEALLHQRRDARARKDFAASDAIRDQLAKMGYAIKDTAGGKVEVRRA